jgi:hypothetical protein
MNADETGSWDGCMAAAFRPFNATPEQSLRAAPRMRNSFYVVGR